MADDELEPLVTECPNCSTRFRVTDSQLQVAGGRVRCGACLTVFQGVDHLLWDDDAQFGSPQEAQDALDELLSELTRSADDAGEAAQAAEPEPLAMAADNPFLPDDKPLYVGFEEDAEDTAAPQQPTTRQEPAAGVAGTGAGSSQSAFAGGDAPRSAAQSDAVEASSGGEAADSSADDASAARYTLAKDVRATPPWAARTGDVSLRPAAGEPLPTRPAAGGTGATTPAARSPAADAPAAAPAAGDERFTRAIPDSLVFEPERRRWWMPLALIAAALALVVQVFWFQYPQWSLDPDLRPVYVTACRVLGCSVPQRRNLAAISSRSLVVRSHPEVTDALIIDALIVNDAPFAQPFPTLEIEFRDLDQNPVAGGRFPPEVYLDGELAGAELMPSRTPIHVDLEIEDPGSDAVNYFLYFR